jgi:long-subunit acyl-CoA synthetase (AMP-forming)
MRKLGSWIKDNGHNVFFIYAPASPYWTLLDLACWNYGLINVPLYDTLGKEAFDYILRITEGTLIFTNSSLIPNLYKYVQNNRYFVKQICFFDSV